MQHMRAVGAALALSALIPLTSCGGQSRCEKARSEVHSLQVQAQQILASERPIASADIYSDRPDVTSIRTYDIDLKNQATSLLTTAGQIITDDPSCFDPAVVASLRG